MKNILSKTVGFLTIFSMVFIMSGTGNLNTARAQVVEDNICASQAFVSDDVTSGLLVDGHAAADVAPIHSAWTASIAGASWVWSENPLADSTIEVTKTFTQTFNISGVPADSELMIAADNEYKVSVNDSLDLFVDAGSNHETVDTHVIAASHLNSGANTITFEVKNLAGGPNTTMADNPAGLMYKLTVNCTPNNNDVCEEVVYMSSDTDADLTVNIGAVTAVSPLNDGWTASILGAEWVWSENPISDTVTSVTRTFTKTFNISGAPTDMDLMIAADNQYKVSVNGGPVMFSDMGEFNYNLEGQDNHVIPASALVTGENTVAFEVTNTGIVDSTWENNPAGLLYKLSTDCDNEPNVCPAYEQVMARVIFAKIANGAQVNGWKNWAPGGDLTNKVFVGGTNPATNELAGNVYDDEEWFPLTNPNGTYINDPDFSFDVPGIAVQRYEGKVRVVLYGFHNSDNGELGGKEFAQAGLEISTNANFEAGLMSPLVQDNTNVNPRIHDPYVNDAANPMDGRGAYTGYINQYDYRFDKMRTINPNRINFHLVVTAGSDGFYGHYDVDGLDCVQVSQDS